MVGGAFKAGGDHHCPTCPPEARFLRRCPKPVEEEADQAWLDSERAKQPEWEPDPHHPEACLRLWVEQPEPAQWFADAVDYERGHLLKAGGLEEQPARWLAGVRVVTTEQGRALEEERERAREGGGK